MKIVFLTKNFDKTNGEGRFSHDFIENLRKEKIQLLAMATEDKILLLNFFKIRKIFKNYDVIHAVDIWPNGFYAWLISLGLKKPIIITALGTYSVAPLYSWRRFFIKWVGNSAQIIAISNYTKEKILEKMPKLKIEVITPGFDFNFWSGAGTEIDETIIKLKPYILSVGALKSRKGYLDSIKAFAILSQKFENLNYIIIGRVGDSDYEVELRKLIKENNLEDRIFLISSDVDDNRLLGFYRNAELFVLTSLEKNHHFEGFGIVYLEAAASGLPIIAAYNSGATSATKEGYNSILVPQNDPQKIADAIIKIISDDNFRSSLSKNSLEWAKRFSQKTAIKKYIEIYNAKYY